MAAHSIRDEARAREALRRLEEVDGPAEIERYRGWITVKLIQGLGLLVLLMAAIVLFDSW